MCTVLGSYVFLIRYFHPNRSDTRNPKNTACTSRLNEEEDPLKCLSTYLCLQNWTVGVFVCVVIYRTYYYSTQDMSLWLFIVSL